MAKKCNFFNLRNYEGIELLKEFFKIVKFESKKKFVSIYNLNFPAQIGDLLKSDFFYWLNKN